jgi:hypothetical protein
MNYTASFFALGAFFLWVVIATLVWARRMRKLKKKAPKAKKLAV